MTSGRRQEQDRTQCTPCRGTGRVVSARGGDPHELPCPWCDGTGRYQPGHDAQASEHQPPAAEDPGAR